MIRDHSTCISAANNISKDTDIFKKDYIPLTSISILFTVRLSVNFPLTTGFWFYIWIAFLFFYILSWSFTSFVNLIMLLYLALLFLMLGCNWPRLAVVKYMNEWTELPLNAVNHPDVLQPEGSTSVIQKPNIGHYPKPVPSTSQTHNLLLYNPLSFYCYNRVSLSLETCGR